MKSSGKGHQLYHCGYRKVNFNSYTVGAPVAQWVKRWPTDLAVVSSRPA